MNADAHWPDDSLAPSLAWQIDPVCKRFESAWNQDQPPRLEEYLGGIAEPLYSALLRELIQLDIYYRRLRGEQPQARDYQERFPVLGNAWLVQTLATASSKPDTDHPDTRLPSKPMAPPPTPGWPTVAGYEILGEIGRGGMGVVYHARQLNLDRPVALKVILTGPHASADEQARFRGEAEAAARIQHPHVVHVLEVGEFDGRPYCALEYVDGGNLDRKLRGQPQPAGPSACLVELLARAVAVAHEQGIVHRDLKPANILLVRSNGPQAVPLGSADESGYCQQYEPKITDFGLAKRLNGAAGQTQTGVVLGTPSYMAPEQAAGAVHAVGPTADVYALGAILYEMLTGRPPFRAATTQETLDQVCTQEPVPPARLQPKVPRDLETICLKCLEKEPRKRYPTALALAEDLHRFQEGKPIVARPLHAGQRLLKWVRRQPLLAALVLTVFVAVTSLLVVGAWFTSQLKAERDREFRARTRAEMGQYAILLHVAFRELREGNLGRAEELLLACRPDTPPWEHRYLRTLCQRRMRTLSGHNGMVRSVAFSPDNRRLATGSAGLRWPIEPAAAGQVKIWDVATSEEIASLTGHTGPVSAVAYHPGGRILASASWDGTVRVWDTQTTRELLTFKQHAGPVLSLAFSADGTRLASSSADQTVRVWDPSNGAEAYTFRGHDGPVSAVAFSPDGRHLASGRSDPQNPDRPLEVKVWEAVTGRENFTVAIGVGAELCLAFSPDGRRLAAAGADVRYPAKPGEVRVLDVATGGVLLALSAPAGPVFGLGFSPDGQRLAGACGVPGDISRLGEVRVWNATTGADVLALRGRGDAILCVAYSPNGRHLLSGGFGAIAHLWDTEAGATAVSLGESSEGLLSMALSPDGQYLAAGSGERSESTRPGKITVWRAATGEPVCSCIGHTGSVMCVAFSPDGRRLVSGSSDQTARVWEIATGEEVLAFRGHSTSVASVGFSPDGQRVVSAGRLEFFPDGSLHPGDVRMWDAVTGKDVLFLQDHNCEGASWTQALFSPDGRRLACGAGDSMVKLWDTGTGREVRSVRGHIGAILSLAFSQDGRLLAGAGGDVPSYAKPGQIKVWDTQTGEELLTLRGHASPAFSLAFNPEGNRLVSGSTDRTVRVWDMVSGQEVLALQEHRDTVLQVAFSVDGDCLTSAGKDRSLRRRCALPSEGALDSFKQIRR